jgi:hypothetical protein
VARQGGGVRKSTTTDTVQKKQGFGDSWRGYFQHYDPREERDSDAPEGAKLFEERKGRKKVAPDEGVDGEVMPSAARVDVVAAAASGDVEMLRDSGLLADGVVPADHVEIEPPIEAVPRAPDPPRRGLTLMQLTSRSGIHGRPASAFAAPLYNSARIAKSTARSPAPPQRK